jgi:hypothetical protein
MQKEQALIQRMLNMSLSEKKRVVQEQRDAIPFDPRTIMMDEDAAITAREARVDCTMKYPASFDYRTTGPPASF